MSEITSEYRGWKRPGPIPPGGILPEEGETLDFICGHFRIFQYERGHRYSTDDVLTAWYGMQWAPRLGRIADLGSGIGSVAIIAAWRCPGATFCTVEAQDISVRLARKSVAYNGLNERFKICEGDLRDAAILRDEDPFDLVFGSPPYFPPGTASQAAHAQAIPARIELRGDINDYARRAAEIMATGGIFAFVFPSLQSDRAREALSTAGLVLVRCRDVIFREGERPLITLFAAWRAADLPSTMQSGSPGVPVVEPPLVIRRRDGSIHPEYAAVRVSFGFPPGNVP